MRVLEDLKNAAEAEKENKKEVEKKGVDEFQKI